MDAIMPLFGATVAMTMMQVGVVRVAVDQRPVKVRVAMRLSRLVVRTMRMLVVLIVHVPVLMF